VTVYLTTGTGGSPGSLGCCLPTAASLASFLAVLFGRALGTLVALVLEGFTGAGPRRFEFGGL